jgi:hypothetical protein
MKEIGTESILSLCLSPQFGHFEFCSQTMQTATVLSKLVKEDCVHRSNTYFLLLI